MSRIRSRRGGHRVRVVVIRCNVDDVTDQLLAVFEHRRWRHADRVQQLAREWLSSDAAARFHLQQADQLITRAMLLTLLLSVIAETTITKAWDYAKADNSVKTRSCIGLLTTVSKVSCFRTIFTL